MRKYTLASPSARQDVDLRNYENIIVEAVQKVIPKAKVTVVADGYFVSPSPEPSQARKIGRTICQSELKHHCVQIPKLFSSIEVKEAAADGTDKQKRTGGHR